MIKREAARLTQAGADYLFICSNTGNEAVGRIRNHSIAPIIHIADVVGGKASEDGYKRLGLLGTIYTMRGKYIKNILENKFALEVLVPEMTDHKKVNRVIYEELCRGIISEESRQQYCDIIHKLRTKGAQVVILGCTEIPLLIKPSDADLPMLNTTELHAIFAAKLALNQVSYDQDNT